MCAQQADAHLAFTGFTGKRLHLGVSGSIAAYRAPDLLRMWMRAGAPVGVSLTDGASRFITPLTFSALGAQPVLTSMFSEGAGALDHQEVFAHLLPGQTAKALVIAPATAGILARIANGMADDLLACQALAFSGPIILAPAMNPRMWRNQATQANVALLRERGMIFVGPDAGRVACHDEGQGRLADVRDIFLAGLKALTPQDLEGETLMVTLGPTREDWDSVRFWTNGSTGVMGASLAVGAWLRGAKVHAVCGPLGGVQPLWFPNDPDFHRHNVGNAGEMFDAAKDVWNASRIGIFTAAVADFYPEPYGQGKFKKNLASEGFSVRFLPNADILRMLAAEKRPDQLAVGFAAESVPDADSLAHAVRRKLVSKGADMVVGNRISDGFAKASNRVFIADIKGREEHWPQMSKPEVAWKILNWVVNLLPRQATEAAENPEQNANSEASAPVVLGADKE